MSPREAEIADTAAERCRWLLECALGPLFDSSDYDDGPGGLASQQHLR